MLPRETRFATCDPQLVYARKIERIRRKLYLSRNHVKSNTYDEYRFGMARQANGQRYLGEWERMVGGGQAVCVNALLLSQLRDRWLMHAARRSDPWVRRDPACIFCCLGNRC
ncbi:hypothetical protein [Massilia genomosp. 1]|uniref:Uncharacterized protein n=1 Tax=Massilia genomosp. 1 TaxID=2609280 RepID=A0ABX0MF61_9BURK|nr:hypothetical protein [Massilia genomosp. 1]NHZ61380.1 hypothetical protein [Massilia genomosp. 1]